MKAILEFDLNDHDDQEAHLRAVKSLDLVLVIWDVEQELRSLIKYGRKSGELSEEEYKITEEIRNRFYEILNERDVNIDKLMS